MLWVMEKVPLPAVCGLCSTLGEVTDEEKIVWNWSFRNVEENVWCLQIPFFYLDVAHLERNVVKTKPTFFLFTNCKSGTNGSAEMCSLCLGYRWHRLYLCFWSFFPPMKIKIWLAQAEMFCRVCCSWVESAAFLDIAMLPTFFSSDQRWAFKLQCRICMDFFYTMPSHFAVVIVLSWKQQQGSPICKISTDFF